MQQKVVYIAGSSGFIGGHLVKALKAQGHYVIGSDIVPPKYTHPDKFYLVDLRYQQNSYMIFTENDIQDVYLMACLMGGMGYIGNKEHDLDIMVGSSQIVANTVELCVKRKVEKLFYASSACCYNMTLQDENSECIALTEKDSYPALPDLTYGWQKLFSEQLVQSANVAHGLDIRIARFHNIFGIEGVYDGGKEKAPAALMRKALTSDKFLEVWGTGEARRSFLYIDTCIEGIFRMMDSDCIEPLNLGSEESVTINQLAQMAIDISGKDLKIKNVDSPFVGVACRNSDNTKIFEKLGWKPDTKLIDGMKKLHDWMKKDIEQNKSKP